jgi:hypothetical protein
LVVLPGCADVPGAVTDVAELPLAEGASIYYVRQIRSRCLGHPFLSAVAFS